MKALIINADDLGYSPAINLAVKECFLKGVISDTSLMACGEYFNDAVNMLHGIGKKEAGAHLALTGGFSPCAENAGEVRSLITAEGVFLPGYWELFTRFFSRKISREALRAEFSAQIEKIQSAGIEVTHIDSHEHIHMLTGIAEIVSELADRYGIPYIRFAGEHVSVMRKDFRVKDLIRYLSLKTFTSGAKKAVGRGRAASNDHFWGHFHSGRISDDVLCYILKNIKNGVNELAVHPAVDSSELVKKNPWYKNASGEFEALLYGKWRGLINAAGIELISYKKIRP
ncbi:MAG: ChbG/HpnK family deacetylase [Candidatus Omnitrophota bacterium]